MALEINLETDVRKDASGAISRAQKTRLQDAMDKGFSVSQENVPEDRGTLRQSGFPPTWDGNVLRFGYRANHAAPMEFGTEPFQPPLEPLLEWSERVTGDTGLGYYVALEKIPSEGIGAQPYMRPAAKAAKRWLQSRDFGTYFEDEL